MNEITPTPKASNKKTNLLLGIIVLLLVIIISGGAYLFTLKTNTTPDSTSQPQENEITDTTENKTGEEDAKTEKETNDSEDKDAIKEEPENKTEETENKDEEKQAEKPDTDEKKDPDLETITLKDVSGGNNEGTASRKYKDNEFSLNLEAKVKDPEKEFQYEAWLIKTGNRGSIPLLMINLGKLEKDENGIYKLAFKTNKDYTRYREIAVTLEPMDSDPDPAGRIMEGTFK